MNTINMIRSMFLNKKCDISSIITDFKLSENTRLFNIIIISDKMNISN